jgi:hypothetical protein
VFHCKIKNVLEVQFMNQNYSQVQFYFVTKQLKMRQKIHELNDIQVKLKIYIYHRLLNEKSKLRNFSYILFLKMKWIKNKCIFGLNDKQWRWNKTKWIIRNICELNLKFIRINERNNFNWNLSTNNKKWFVWTNAV